MLEETHDNDQIIQRVAALDVGKAELTCCVRVPGQGRSGKRLQEVRTYPTMTRSLLVLADRLGELGVTRVVMEATSDSWKGASATCWKPRGSRRGWQAPVTSKHLPGRPKTDTLDAVWLCKLAERQMLRPSFVPPRPIRQLRDLTRYRADLVAARTAEKQRVEQAAGWTPRSTSRWWPATASGSPAGPCWPRWSPGSVTPRSPAQLARTRLRAKLGSLAQAFTGCFTDQHAFLLGKMLGRVDALDADLAELDAKLAELIAPFAAAVDRLDEIPGVGQLAAQLLIAELGTDTGQVPDRWAPGVVGQVRPRRQLGPPANPRAAERPGTATPIWLGCSARSPSLPARPLPSLVHATDGSPVDAASNERSSRSAGPSWSLSGTCCPTQRPTSTTSAPACSDTRIGPERAKRNHIRQLAALGYKVTLEPAA